MDRDRRWWWSTWPAWAVDIVVVLGVGLLQVCTSVAAATNQPGARPLDPMGYLLLTGTALALLGLRHRPVVVLAVALAGSVGYFAFQYPYALSPLAALIAMFVVIARDRRTPGWLAAGCLIAVPALATGFAERTTDNIAAALLWAMVVVVVGQLAEVSRARRAYTAEMERRVVEAEHGREEEALRRAHEERLRITRELHDVTSHTVSVIALQAAAAIEALDRPGGPEQVRAALRIIRSASRQAMAEMTAVLGVLRADRGSGLRQPMPGVEQIRDLAQALGDTGLRVEFVQSGAVRPLPPALELTVYRVAQEALTNTLRHAGASVAVVTLRFEPDGVVVHVDDDGRERAPANGSTVDSGHGLAGMAERVSAVGGRLAVGRGASGGFQVVAWLPTEAGVGA